MDILVVIGRILFSAIFIMAGFGHFARLSMMAQYAGSKGVPAPKFMVAFTGAMNLLGGLSILLGAYAKIGAWLIFLFLVPTALMMHNFWTMQDPMAKATEQAMFMKNLAMAGAVLLIAYFGSGPFSLVP